MAAASAPGAVGAEMAAASAPQGASKASSLMARYQSMKWQRKRDGKDGDGDEADRVARQIEGCGEGLIEVIGIVKSGGVEKAWSHQTWSQMQEPQGEGAVFANVLPSGTVVAIHTKECGKLHALAEQRSPVDCVPQGRATFMYLAKVPFKRQSVLEVAFTTSPSGREVRMEFYEIVYSNVELDGLGLLVASWRVKPSSVDSCYTCIQFAIEPCVEKVTYKFDENPDDSAMQMQLDELQDTMVFALEIFTPHLKLWGERGCVMRLPNVPTRRRSRSRAR